MTTASFDHDRRPAGPDLDTFLDALTRHAGGRAPRRSGREWKAICPAHDDHNESLDVRAGDRQPVVATCRSHACSWSDILAALGLESPRPLPAYRPPGRTAAAAPAPAPKKAEKRQLGPVVAEYPYVDEAGQLLYVVVRREPKAFQQKRPDPDRPGWKWNLDGVRRVPYRLPQLREAIARGDVVFLVEGEKDADRLAGLGLAGTAHAQGAKNWRPDYAPHFRDAHVVVIPDHDAEGRAWADAVVSDLIDVAATVRRLELPDLPPKGDVSDYLDGDRDVEDLQRLVDAEPVITRDGADAEGPRYEADARGMYVTLPGRPRMRLCNFSARIVEDAIADDGAEERTAVTLAVTLAGQARRVTVPVTELGNPARWGAQAFGAAARTEVVANGSEHIRAAVQTLSPPLVRRTVYGHTGWRTLDDGDRRVYLHAGGALGAGGPVPDVAVDLPPALSHVELVPPADRMAAVTAVLGSLQLLELAPDAVTVPLLGAVWRSVMGPSDFGVWLTGGTGAGKSQIAALMQAHFGVGFTSSTLPGSWSSTGNALEELSFLHNGLLVIDDFAPTGSSADISALHRTAERVIRAQGNGAGRTRMSRDLKVLAARPPRGTLLGTGEDVPRGQSLRGRLLICHLDRSALNWTALSTAQERGRRPLRAGAQRVRPAPGRAPRAARRARQAGRRPPGAAADGRGAQPDPHDDR